MNRRKPYQNFSFRKGVIKWNHSTWLITLVILLWSLQVSASFVPYEDSSLKEDKNSGMMTLRQNSQQKIIISGIVTSLSDNLPLPGATVIEKSSVMNATTTNLNGEFTLTVSGEQAVLIISFIGMKTQEVPVNGGRAPLLVNMEVDSYSLEEVVVTGYGTIKKGAYAGSVSIVKMDKLSDVPVNGIGQLLQGSTTGVQFTNSSGQPGAATQIRVRGTGSFNASNDPLYVIDGVPIISGNVSSLGTDAGLDILSTMSPNDIESISVIKDAAAASLYGSRAANGVIIITTKKGISGTARVNFKTEMGFSDFATPYRPFMGGDERRATIYEGLINNRLYYQGTDSTAAIAYADANIDKYAKLPWTGVWTDWKALLFRKGKYRNNEVSITGGTDKIKYFSSLGYTEQEGVSVMSYLNRLSGRLNLSYDVSKRLSAGINTLFSNVKQSTNTEGTTYIGPFYSVFNTVPPRDVPFLEDGSYAFNFPRNGQGRNPKAYADLNYENENIIRAYNTIYASYRIIDDLELKSTVSHDFNMIKGEQFTHPLSAYPPALGSIYKSFYDVRATVWTNSAQYMKTFATVHDFDALIAYEITDYSVDNIFSSKENLANWDMVELDNFSVSRTITGLQKGYRMLSYISRVNYDYNKKYFAGFSFRRDGSSRLASKSRWGNFWSLSGAWKISDEVFFEKLKDILPEVKLRASYGINGTLPSGYYDYMGISNYTAYYNLQPGLVETQPLNSNLQWETNHNANIGIDLNLFDKVRISVEYYNRLTKNLLMDEPTSLTTGFTSTIQNIGEMQNRGVEAEFISTIIDAKNFSWTSSFNLSHNQNKILVLDGVQTSIIDGTQIRMVGKPYHTFYLREFGGIDPADGTTWFYLNTKDADGNYIKDQTKLLNLAQAIPLQSPYPKVTGGFINNFRFHFVDLGFTFTYSLGGYSYDSGAGKLEKEGVTNSLDANIPTYYRDRWRKPGDISDYGIYIAHNKWDLADDYSNSRRIHSTDHLRLKNISLGVNVPQKFTKYLRIDRARFFVSGNNVWTLAKWKYYDPEVGYDGVMGWRTPALKTYTFGLDLTF